MYRTSPAALVLALALVVGPSAAIRAAGPADAAADQQASSAPAATKKVCKYVVASDPGAKPYELCLSAVAWAARDKMAAKDATRLECHYVEKSGWKFESAKVCMAASEWEDQRRIQQQQIERIQAASCAGGQHC